MTKHKKNRIIYGAIVLVLLIICIRVVSTIFGIPVYTYPGFGIGIPPGYNSIGIDVSHYQSKINWEQVKDMRDLGMRIQFVFIKATQGTYQTDGQFNRNWREAKKYNIQRGAYLFFDPRQNGRAQANHFIKKVKLQSGDFAPVVDVEDLYGMSKANCRKEALACIKRLQQHYGVKPIIYSYTNFYKNNLGSAFDQYPLWIAHYKSFGKPRITRDWAVWQHSDKGRVNGIGGAVDFNVFGGNHADWKALQLQ